jgi:uncharacterized protein YyaL (SSP411 family)
MSVLDTIIELRKAIGQMYPGMEQDFNYELLVSGCLDLYNAGFRGNWIQAIEELFMTFGMEFFLK